MLLGVEADVQLLAVATILLSVGLILSSLAHIIHGYHHSRWRK